MCYIIINHLVRMNYYFTKSQESELSLFQFFSNFVLSYLSGMWLYTLTLALMVPEGI
jgi:hypothetical protein